MKRWVVIVAMLLLIVSVVFSAGCSLVNSRTHNVDAGTSYVKVGEVGVTKALVYTGNVVDDTLQISADENGNARVAVGKGVIELIPFYLSSTANAELSEYFIKLVNWGEIAKKEKIETEKQLGYVSTSTGFAGGTALVSLTFLSGPSGENWVSKLHFCKIRSTAEMMFAPSAPIGSNPCVKEVEMYVSQTSIIKFKEYLAMVPDFSSKAASSKSKSNLLN